MLDAAARLPADQFAAAALGACKLRDTLEHILSAESVWRLRWEGTDPATVAFPDSFATIEDLILRWRAEDQLLAAYLDTLSDADLDAGLTFSRGETRVTRTLWHLLVHVVNHGTQHRAEAALLLTALDCSPGDVDFTAFIRAEERKRTLDEG
ncbi:MAG: DinB family protein [Herpetosiphonaceae bacterium]|nr:DinB family protein [Herpetosiphonaceae bacterium]